MNTNKVTYRIYGKECDKKKFLPMDLKEGVFVTNLIYASLIDSRESAQKQVDYMNKHNKGITFEVREA